MKNYHIIEVKYIGPTDTQGARVKLFSQRLNESKIISFDYSKNSITDMAKDYLETRKFKIVGMGESKMGYAIITDTFKSLK